MSDDDFPIVLREPNAADLPFIFSSWLKSYRHEGDNRHMRDDVYYAAQKPKVTTALRRGVVLIACNPNDTDQIYGWVCGERAEPVVHYLYVKYTFRHFGIARRLFDAVTRGERPVVCSHTGLSFYALRERHQLTYDPRRIDG